MRTLRGILFLIIAAAYFAQGADPLPIETVQGRPVVTGVYINGAGPFRFLLDTGAQTNQLEAGLANKLGLTPKFRVEMATAAGVQLVPGGTVELVQLGESRRAKQEFLFTSLSGVRQIAKNLDGVLGQEFLGGFDYQLDFQHHTLSFGEREGAGARIPVTRKDGSLVVPTSEGGMILDSGTDAAILFRAGPGVSITGMATATGSAQAVLANGLKIRIDGKDYRPRQTAIAPNANSRAAGLLPASLFRAVYICNSEGYIVVR